MQKLSQVIFETYLRAFILLQKSNSKSKDTKKSSKYILILLKYTIVLADHDS
jgi:hypothetical protein